MLVSKNEDLLLNNDFNTDTYCLKSEQCDLLLKYMLRTYKMIFVSGE